MKTRQGFVSNSSTSSFLIFYKDKVCDKCGRGGILHEILKRSYSYGDNTEIYTTDIDEAIKKLSEYPGEESSVSWINDNRKLVNEGYHFIYCSIEYRDEMARAEIKYLLDKNQAVVYKDGASLE